MLPVHLIIDATIKQLDAQGIFYYILQRGEKNSGTILLKLTDRNGTCKLLTQQRDLDGDLKWINALNEETPKEPDIDIYVARSKDRDPDLWIIEVEDSRLNNPFEV